MAICLLVRHGHSSANAEGVLSGWAPGISLTETGRAQAVDLRTHLANRGVAAVISSPLQRCVETAALLADVEAESVATDEGLGECHYGAWTGRRLSDLARDPLWRTVQDDPAGARFPDDETYAAESLAEMTARVWETLATLDARVEAEHASEALWVAVSHGDPIRSALATAMGSGVAGLQRSRVDPGSVSCLRWSSGTPFVVGTNGDGSSLERWLAAPRHSVPSGDAVPGGDV